MKLKESKGISLIVFTIILAVLVVVVIGVIVYLLNNPVKEGTTIQTPTGVQSNTDNNQVVETYKNLDLNSAEVKGLLEKVSFEHGTTATLYNRGDFNLNTISNDLILKLGWDKTTKKDEYSASLGMYTESATEEVLKNSIVKIFGNNIKYNNDSFKDVDKTIFAPMGEESVTYKNGTYTGTTKDGGNPFKNPEIYIELQSARKYNDKIEIEVKTAFVDYDYTNADETGETFIIYRDLSNGKTSNKVLSQTEKIDLATAVSSIKDKLNTYIYTFNLDSTTGEYYLTSFAKTKVGTEISVNNKQNEYKTLNELALLKISSDKLNKKEEIYEYDFNKDGIKEKLTLKQTEDEYVYSIHYGNQEITDGTYGFRVYVVDLDESDNYLDLILSEISDGGEFTSYYIYKNNGTSLEKLKYTTEKAITGDYEGNNFCLDKNNNFILLGDPEASLDSIVTNTYYSIKNNDINSAKIENIEISKTYKVKKEHVDFTTDYNKTTIEYTAENRYLKVGTELQIIEWLKGPDGQEIIKVKLASGEIGYIYEAYA